MSLVAPNVNGNWQWSALTKPEQTFIHTQVHAFLPLVYYQPQYPSMTAAQRDFTEQLLAQDVKFKTMSGWSSRQAEYFVVRGIILQLFNRRRAFTISNRQPCTPSPRNNFIFARSHSAQVPTPSISRLPCFAPPTDIKKERSPPPVNTGEIPPYSVQKPYHLGAIGRYGIDTPLDITAPLPQPAIAAFSFSPAREYQVRGAAHLESVPELPRATQKRSMSPSPEQRLPPATTKKPRKNSASNIQSRSVAKSQRVLRSAKSLAARITYMTDDEVAQLARPGLKRYNLRAAKAA